MKTVTHYLRGVVFAAGLASAGVAAAQESPSPASTSEAALAVEDAEVLSMEDMEALAGGTGVEIQVITDSVLTAANSGNTVTGDVVGSGNVDIGSAAFSGYSGLGNFVINTGHNNNLQASMNVSITLAPAATPGP